MRALHWALALILAATATGCDDEDEAARQAKAAASAKAAAEAKARAEAEAEPPPGPCKAGDEPVKLAKVIGDVYGFAGDATHLYFTSWSLYGGRGDVGWIRKDGLGMRTKTSLELEPRSLVMDDKQIYYTMGIRLMTIPKGEGGEEKQLEEIFPSQSIDLHKGEIYGVPGDYGPYDRVAKVKTKGGEVKELVRSDRPEVKRGLNGWMRLVVQDSGIYVTDAGKGRVIRIPLEGGLPKVLAGRVEKPFELVVDDSSAYFTLADAGELMVVPKKGGGKATKLAAGLVENAQLAGDEKGVYVTFKGENEDAPLKLSKVVTDGGKVTPIASVPADQTVDAIAIDATCVYWAQRVDAGETNVYARKR